MLDLDPIAYLNKSKTRRTMIFHLILWVLAFTILVFVFTKGKIPVKIDYYYTFVFLCFLAIPAMLNFHVLIPYLLKKEKYIYYVIGIVSLGLSFGVFIKAFYLQVIDYIFPNYFFISYISGNDFYLVFSIFLLASTLLKLAQDWVYFNRTENDILKLKNLHVESQLSALRSQINPHFLFNSLNVIYSMALSNKENMSTAIVELSDILRYVIYDANTELVLLKKELDLINSYVAFQKYRVKTEVIFQQNIEDENYKIYPMLLLPLIENAYKYGVSSQSVSNPIDIRISQKNKQLCFTIKNQKLNTSLNLEKNYSGVGISTLKKNLALVYPKRHSFEIRQTEDYFEASLTIHNF